MAASSTTRYGNGGGQKTGLGAGKGGPKKGDGVPDKAPQFKVGNKAAVGRDCPNIDKMERREALHENLFWLAFNGENDTVRLNASDKLLDRIEGKAVARVINHNTDDITALDDDALAARRAELERELGSGDGRTATQDDPQEP